MYSALAEARSDHARTIHSIVTAASRKMPARKTKRSVTRPMAVIDSANPPTSGHPLGETGFSLPYSPSASAAELAPTEAGTEASR